MATYQFADFPVHRTRRLRQHPAVRDLIRETHLDIKKFILPLFVREDISQKLAIDSMPGHFQLPLNDLPQELDEIMALGIQAIIVFGIPAQKDPDGLLSCEENNIVGQAIRVIKAHAPHLLVIADVCLCEYTDHGHCGVLRNNAICNDETLAVLKQQTIMLAHAGADMLAPSGMMDGMVTAIRSALDQTGYTEIPILSYAAKYYSALYGPFRSAANSAPQFGDRSSYQMDPANAEEALREAALDVAEGADILMVKPASFYLDIIYRVKSQWPGLPLCAYQVSGEFAMLKAAASTPSFDEKRLVIESLTAIHRAGADMIITYFAKDLAKWLA